LKATYDGTEKTVTFKTDNISSLRDADKLADTVGVWGGTYQATNVNPTDDSGNTITYVATVTLSLTSEAEKNYYIYYGDYDEDGNDDGHLTYEWVIEKASSMDADSELALDTLTFNKGSDKEVTLTSADLEGALTALGTQYAGAKLTDIADYSSAVTATATTANAVVTGATVSVKTTAAAATYYFKAVFSTNNCTAVTAKVAVVVKEKNDVSSKILFDEENVEVVYTGEAQDLFTGHVYMGDREGMDGNITIKIEPTTSSAGDMDETNGTLPVGAGVYKVTATYEDTSDYGEASTYLTITKAPLSVKQVNLKEREYVAAVLTAELATENQVEFEGLVGKDLANKASLAKDADYTVDITAVRYADDKIEANKETDGAVVTLAKGGNLIENYTLTGGDNAKCVGTITGKSVTVSVKVTDIDYETDAANPAPIVTVAVNDESKTVLTLDIDYTVTVDKLDKTGETYSTAKVAPKSTSAYTFTETSVRFKVDPDKVAADPIVDEKPTLEAASVADLSVTYTEGTEPTVASLGLGTSVILKDETVVNGAFSLSDEQIAAIKALTENGTAKVTFTPDENDATYANTGVELTVNVTFMGAVDPTKAALTPAEVDVSGLTLNYTEGTEPDVTGLGTSVTLIAGGTVNGTFSLTTAQTAAIKALTGNDNVTVTFTPAADDTTYNTSTVELTVSVIFTAAKKDDEPTMDAPTIAEDEVNAADEETVIVRLASSTVRWTGRALKPAVTVYENGVKLSASKYNKKYSDNIDEGIATVTITKKDGSDFANGEESIEQTFAIVKDTSDALVLNMKDLSLTYGSYDEDPSNLVKGSVKFNGKTVRVKDVEWSWGLAGDENVGVYEVALTGTYKDVSVTTQIMVTVKAKKITVTMPTMTTKSATGLDSDIVYGMMEDYLVISDEDVDFSDLDVVYKSSPKTVKKGLNTWKWTVSVNNPNYTLGSSSKTISVKVRVTG
jgi:hypothetical protein